VIGCAIFAAIHNLMSGRQFIYFYTCCGIEPSEYKGLTDKPDGYHFHPKHCISVDSKCKNHFKKIF